jgi:hypothetical protein
MLRRIAKAFSRRKSASADQPSQKRQGPCSRTEAPPGLCSYNAICDRLAEGAACLIRLDEERGRRGDSCFGKTAEDRIVWSELIDLEMQEIDEQVSRICDAATRRPRASKKPNLG